MPPDSPTIFESADSALSLMSSAPATPGTSDWIPDDTAPPTELPPETVEAAAADDETPPADAGADDTPAVDGQGETQDETPDPEVALPPIEPPSSWKTEEKDAFKTLPRAAQEAIARREQDRTTELRNIQNAQAEQRKQLEGEVARLKGLTSQVDTAASDRLADLTKEFPDIKTQADVEALAATNPARFSLFQAKLMRFNSAQQDQQRVQQELAAQADATNREMVSKAREALLEAFPTWKDAAVGRKEMTELQDYAITLGVPEQAARATFDPHVYKLTQKAMAYDRAQAKVTEARNTTAPKVVKPGTAPTKGEQRADQRATAIRKLEKSGDLEDALALMRA